MIVMTCNLLDLRVIMHFMYTTAISDESQLYTNMRVRKWRLEGGTVWGTVAALIILLGKLLK